MTVWLLSTCVLIAVLMLLRRALRGRADPRLVYALWLLAAVRVLVPGSLFDLPVSVSGLAESAGVTQAVEDARYATQREETYGSKNSGQADVEDIHGLEDMDWVRRESWLGSQNITDVEVVDAQEVPAEEAGGDPDSGSTYVRLELEVTRDRFAFLRYIWYAGIALVAVWFLFVNLRFARRLRRQGVPYTEGLPMDCPLPVYVVDGLSTPCLAGLLRPAIYLNRAALNSGHLDHILTHELVHYRHRDHWWAVVRCACLAVQWFNPLVWAAAYLSRQDCETACDASAIGRLGEGERLAYGHTLVNMIAAGRHPAALFQTATTMTGSLTSIRQRVTLIAKKPRMTALTLAVALVVSVLAAGCAFGGAGQSLAQKYLDETPQEEQESFFLSVASDCCFTSTTELDSEYLFRFAVLTAEDDRWDAWYDEETRLYTIPLTDVTDVLDQYFEAYEFDPSQTIGAQYDEATGNFVTEALGYGSGKTAPYLKSVEAVDDTTLRAVIGDRYHSDTVVTAKVTRDGPRFVSYLPADGSGFDFSQLYELPEELAGQVTVKIDADYVVYYHTPEIDPAYSTLGELWCVVRADEYEFEQRYGNPNGSVWLGQDGEYRYCYDSPDDAAFADGYQAEYETLAEEVLDWLQSLFQADESIVPLDLSDTPFVDDFSYSGNHIDVTVWPYGDSDDPDAPYWTLVLSQPATQGDGGIWCVERAFYTDENGVQPTMYVLPETDLTAAEYYAQLQAQADAGEVFSSTTAGYDEGNTAVNFVYQWLELDSAGIGYGEMYSAGKGASRDDIGPAITGTDAAMQAQELYDTIVGMGRLSTFQKDFYLEVDDGGEVTRLLIGQMNGPNVNHTGDFMLGFTWETSFMGQSPSGISITIQSADGDSWIQCWENSDLVLLHQDGEDVWATATAQDETWMVANTQSGDPLYRWLLAWADEAMRYQITYGITMDGALTDYQQVAEQYLEQMAAAWRAAPDWMPSKPEDVQPGSATVTQAYWGEGENFCTSTLLYIQTDPMGEGAGYWQAGSGLHEIEEGPYTTANGYYVYNLGRDFARNENGDWVCTGGYTGGEMVTLPTPVEEATVEQLVDYFFHTSGFAHDYSILNELSDRSTQELATLNDILPGCSDDEARQFCAALGLHLSEYAQYHDLGYQGLYGLLDEPYRTYLGGARVTDQELALSNGVRLGMDLDEVRALLGTKEEMAATEDPERRSFRSGPVNYYFKQSGGRYVLSDFSVDEGADLAALRDFKSGDSIESVLSKLPAQNREWKRQATQTLYGSSGRPENGYAQVKYVDSYYVIEILTQSYRAALTFGSDHTVCYIDAGIRA